jgi:Tfp pilus assembly protein PilF
VRLLLLLVGLAVLVPVRAQPPAGEPDAPVRGAEPPAEALLLRALTRLGAGDASDAAELLRGAVSAYPGNAALLVALAEATARTGDRTGARLHAEAAVRAAPDAPAPVLALARILDDGGDRAAARRTLEAFLARHADAHAVRLAAARLAAVDGDDPRARALLTPLLDAPAPDVLEVALRAVPEGDPARPALLAWALQLAPDDRDRYLRLHPRPESPPAATLSGDGRAAFLTGRFEEAYRLLAAQAEADATDPVRWRLAAMAALEAGAPDAARLIEDARLIFAADAALAVVAAYAALTRGNAAEARAHADEAEAALREVPDPRAAEALVHLRRVLGGNAPDAPGLARDGLAPAPGGRLARAVRTAVSGSAQ